jgi:hypothetical protein
MSEQMEWKNINGLMHILIVGIKICKNACTCHITVHIIIFMKKHCDDVIDPIT